MVRRSKKFAFKHFVKEVLQATQQDTMTLHAAALSFFSIFTFIPVLIITYLLYNKFAQNVATEFLITTSDTLGSAPTNILINIASDVQNANIPTITYIIGVLIIIYAMTRLMYFMQKSMNKIWKAKQVDSLIQTEVRHRSISIISVFALIILTTIISLQKIAIMQLNKITGIVFAQTIFFITAAIAMYSIFAFLYKFVPDRTIQWTDVMYGSVFSTVFFWASYGILRRVMQYSFIDNIYATISYALLAFIWIYYFAQIFYIGAEICKIHALHYGSLQKHRDEFIE